MNILVACEESQAITIELRKLGHIAFSCDLLPCSGGHPEWHIQGDCSPLLLEPWDMVIAHPPCTYLSYAAKRVWDTPGRDKLRDKAMEFFLKCYNANAPRVAVENPVGYPFEVFRKPDQIVHPYMFGDTHTKRTCFWLRGLPNLETNRIYNVPDPFVSRSGRRYAWVESIGGSNRAQLRSKTSPYLARAIAEQWTCTSPTNMYRHYCDSFNQLSLFDLLDADTGEIVGGSLCLPFPDNKNFQKE